MRRWFWPGLTWTACLTALALWFGIDRIEADIAGRTELALKPYVWAGFDIDGRDVVLKGMAPDPEARRAAYTALERVRGIRDIADLTTVLQLVSPYTFRIEKSTEGLILSGFIPDNELRDEIIAAAGQIEPDISVDDEMALARGNQAEFKERVLFIIDLAKKLAEAEIVMADAKLSIRGVAPDETVFNEVESLRTAQLPYDLELTELNIKQSGQ